MSIATKCNCGHCAIYCNGKGNCPVPMIGNYSEEDTESKAEKILRIRLETDCPNFNWHGGSQLEASLLAAMKEIAELAIDRGILIGVDRVYKDEHGGLSCEREYAETDKTQFLIDLFTPTPQTT